MGCSIKRIAYLDYWRGLFHVLMLVDHLPFLFPATFTLVAGMFEFLGYVSVAEGFVFLSGYTTGLVYTRVKQEQGHRGLWRKAARRAFTIYSTYIAAVVLLIVLVKWLGEAEVSWGSWSRLLEGSLPAALVCVTSLLWQPAFLEILPMYCVFLLLAPLAINQLDRKRHWLVIATSVLLWAANQFDLRGRFLDVLRIEATHLGYFNFFAWQILFVGGMMCGHRTYRVNRPWLPQSAILPLTAYFLAVFFFAWHHHVLEIPLNQWWLRRASLGPLRLLNFACIVFLAARFRGLVEKCIGWKGFAFLSRHSLQVFAFHLIPIYLVSLVFAERTGLNWQAQLPFVGFCVLGLFGIARLAQASKSLRRKPVDSRGPAPVESVATT